MTFNGGLKLLEVGGSIFLKNTDKYLAHITQAIDLHNYRNDNIKSDIYEFVLVSPRKTYKENA
jgi:hypothetical protein